VRRTSVAPATTRWSAPRGLRVHPNVRTRATLPPARRSLSDRDAGRRTDRRCAVHVHWFWSTVDHFAPSAAAPEDGLLFITRPSARHREPARPLRQFRLISWPAVWYCLAITASFCRPARSAGVSASQRDTHRRRLHRRGRDSLPAAAITDLSDQEPASYPRLWTDGAHHRFLAGGSSWVTSAPAARWSRSARVSGDRHRPHPAPTHPV